LKKPSLITLEFIDAFRDSLQPFTDVTHVH